MSKFKSVLVRFSKVFFPRLSEELEEMRNDLRNNMELIEEQNVRLDIARKDAIRADHELKNYLGAKGQYSKRELVFEPHQKQAAIQILSYFQEIVDSKYKDMNVRVSIRQEADKVIMIIISPDNEIKERVEKTFEDYASVVTGSKPVESLLQDKLEIASLKTKLDIAEAEVKSMERILQISEDNNNFLQLILQNAKTPQPQINIIGSSATSYSNSNLANEINLDVSVEMKQITREISDDFESLIKTKNLPQNTVEMLKELNNDAQQLQKANSVADLASSPKLEKIKNFIQQALEQDSPLHNKFDGLLSGIESIKSLAKKYNSLAEILLLPQFPLSLLD